MGKKDASITFPWHAGNMGRCQFQFSTDTLVGAFLEITFLKCLGDGRSPSVLILNVSASAK